MAKLNSKTLYVNNAFQLMRFKVRLRAAFITGTYGNSGLLSYVKLFWRYAAPMSQIHAVSDVNNTHRGRYEQYENDLAIAAV